MNMTIKKRAIAKIVGVLLSLATGPAWAGLMNYNFTYGFSESGQTLQVTGSFIGNDNGAYADDITALTLSFGQPSGPFTSFGGPLYIVNYFSTLSGIPTSSNGRVYFDKGLNNFLMLNCDYGAAPCAATELFLLRNGAGGGDEDANLSFNSSTVGRDNNYDASTWTLTSSAITNVPEPGTLLLLTLGLAGVGFSRYKRA